VYSVLFHGLAAAMILYIISVGLSITMGMMNFVNLAHGVFAMAGGYAAFHLMTRHGLAFAAAVPLAVLLVAAASFVLERLLYARLYRASELDQVMFTIGLVFIAGAFAQLMFGPATRALRLPELMTTTFAIGPQLVPAYRLLIILLGFAIFAALYLAIERTAWGAELRATVDNRRMAETVGIRTQSLFSWTFMLGSALAALGGALGAEFLPVRPAYAAEQLIYVMIVVSVGGLGTVHGPFLAALLLGIGDTACRYFVPQFGAFFIFVALIVILLWRPSGLAGRT
jgi:branched-chain amino acid transport system permease protein